MIRSIWDKIIADDLRGISGRRMELEAFAHGALCIAVSGRCGMSLFNSNASANRGACEQNCRKEYTVTDNETGKQMKIDNNLIMSPNDIATIDFMDQLLESGIRVLKIEGRGRAPEYVSKVTRAYSAAVQAVCDGEFNPETVKGLYDQLTEVYNRGMSSGYYLGREQGWSGTYGSKATRRKVYIGDVKKFYGKIQVADVEVKTGNKLNAGDEIVIIGNTTGVVEQKAEGLRLDEDEVEAVKKGDLFSLKVAGKVRPNDKLYVMQEVDA